MLAHCDFKQASTTFPFLRVGLATCQLTAPKSQCKDGFAKLIHRSDWEKLKGKKLSDDILAAERLMSAAWTAVEASGLGLEKVAVPFGKFQIRLCLHLLGKESKSRETTKFKNLTEIHQKFGEDMRASQGFSAQGGVVQGEGDPQSSSAAVSVQSLCETSDAVAILLSQQKHLKVGQGYTFKEEPSKVWVLKEVTGTVGKLVHKPLFEGPQEKEVPHSELKALKLWNKPMPQLIEESVRQSLLPCSSSILQEEVDRVKAQAALYEKIMELLGCNLGHCFFL